MDGCPNCSHTMHSLGFGGYFWCPRCGTLRRVIRDADGDFVDNDDNRPKLVDRCREFEGDAPTMFGDAWTGAHWDRLGIAESINRPEDRK